MTICVPIIFCTLLLETYISWLLGVLTLNAASMSCTWCFQNNVFATFYVTSFQPERNQCFKQNGGQECSQLELAPNSWNSSESINFEGCSYKFFMCKMSERLTFNSTEVVYHLQSVRKVFISCRRFCWRKTMKVLQINDYLINKLYTGKVEHVSQCSFRGACFWLESFCVIPKRGICQCWHCVKHRVNQCWSCVSAIWFSRTLVANLVLKAITSIQR